MTRAPNCLSAYWTRTGTFEPLLGYSLEREVLLIRDHRSDEPEDIAGAASVYNRPVS